MWRGMSQEALTLLHTQPALPGDRDLTIEMFAIESVAYARMHSFPDADRSLDEAGRLCAGVIDPLCGSVVRARGVLAIERGQPVQAREFFSKSLSLARATGDQFLEATALLNLGVSSLKEAHFDEAVEWTDSAYRISTAIDAGGNAALTSAAR